MSHGRTPPGTGATPQTQPEQRARRPGRLFICGSVMLDDGTPPPSGVVIERSCNGVKRREAYVDSNGRFSFQVGATNYVMPDATGSSVPRQGLPASAATSPSLVPFGMDSAWSVALTGCELRAQLAGYRSNVLKLDQFASFGSIDVGGMVLYPIARVPGTTVSVTLLQAPQNARKALARAEKEVRNGDLEEAERHLKTAVAAFPRYAAAWFRLGLVYRQSARNQEARGAFSKAIEADRNYVNPYIELGRLAHLEQKWQEAADLTGQALALDPVDFPEAYFMNSLANYYLDQMDLAEQSARNAMRLDGQHRFPQLHVLLANILELKKDITGMAEELRTYLRIAPESADAARVRARLKNLENAKNGSATDLETAP